MRTSIRAFFFSTHKQNKRVANRRMMAFPSMLPVYGLLIKTGAREIGSFPKQYQIPIAEYLAKPVEGK
ncbi:CD1375 family protein [Sporosarcina sp. FSL K6-1508]|uniref:CD1375 family protein n=1 Tax=Sporosarcina sp. FSL K6-1508 TaxID=2921553 RepID=UPI0030F82CF1